MQVSRVNRTYRNAGSNDEPANSNRRPRSADVIPFRGGQTPDDNPLHQTQDEQFSTRYQNPYATDRPTNQSINRVERQYEQAPRPAPPRRRIPNLRRKKVLHKHSAQHTTKVALARARVTAINAWVVGWGVFWYLTFQLPFALIGTAGLGMATAVLQLEASLTPEGDGFFSTVAGVLISGLTSLLAAAAQLFGLNFDPMILFIAPFALTFLLGLLQLILTWFMYSVAGVRSLSGQSGGVKTLLFTFAAIGYALPILNLFPLIFLWTTIVWLRPK